MSAREDYRAAASALLGDLSESDGYLRHVIGETLRHIGLIEEREAAAAAALRAAKAEAKAKAKEATTETPGEIELEAAGEVLEAEKAAAFAAGEAAAAAKD